MRTLPPLKPILFVPLAATPLQPLTGRFEEFSNGLRDEISRSLVLAPGERRRNEFSTGDPVTHLSLDPNRLNFGRLIVIYGNLRGLSIPPTSLHKKMREIISGLILGLLRTREPAASVDLGIFYHPVDIKWGPVSRSTGGHRTARRQILRLAPADLVADLLIFGGLDLLREIVTRGSDKKRSASLQMTVNHPAAEIGFGVPYALRLHADAAFVRRIATNPFRPQLQIRPGRSVRLTGWRF